MRGFFNQCAWFMPGVFYEIFSRIIFACGLTENFFIRDNSDFGTPLCFV